MANDSSTGGYVVPNPSPPSPAPLEGRALLTFLQGWIVGVTGLPGKMVRPRWQIEPPNIPTNGTIWAALGISNRKADTFAYIAHDPVGPTGDGADNLQRHEELTLDVDFYDDGVTGLADLYAAVLRDGAAIGQNREPLFAAGFGLVEVTDIVSLPSLLKEQWLYRASTSVVLRRQVDRSYPILNVESAAGDIIDEATVTVPFSVVEE
jgi:hypothetical protein